MDKDSSIQVKCRDSKIKAKVYKFLIDKYFLAFNDTKTRAEIRADLGLLYPSYNILCDETNNIPSDIDKGKLSVKMTKKRRNK